MADFESFTKELVLHRYSETKLFSGDTIEKLDFTDIDLKGVRFEDAKIVESFLDRAMLEGFRMTRTAVVQSNCNYITARGASIAESVFTNCSLLKSDFTHSNSVGLRMTNCIAHSLDFSDSSVIATVFTDCQMQKARFERSVLMKVVFRKASFDGFVMLGKAVFNGAMVVDCTFSSVDISGASLAGTVFIGCAFNDTMLDPAECAPARFIHCTLNGKPMGKGISRSGL
jgi:uncharacterized protein YjbI with pentapeptide repeats